MVCQKVQIVLFHADEKWFMSLVKRVCNKCVPEFGRCPVFNRIHHKNSVEELLAICAVAIVPFNNDLRLGDGREDLSHTMWRVGSCDQGFVS